MWWFLAPMSALMIILHFWGHDYRQKKEDELQARVLKLEDQVKQILDSRGK